VIIIADTNIIISALIKPKGSVASVLKDRSNLQFMAPFELLVEVHAHWNTIAEMSSLSRKELVRELDFYKNKISFTDLSKTPKRYRTEALEIVKDIDVKDSPFIALHLLKKHKIWTGDKVLINGLKAKGYNIFVTTAELRQKMYKKKGNGGIF